MKTLTKLRDYTRQFAARCVQARWGAPAFHVGVQEQLLADALLEKRALSDAAYNAQQADLEAIQTLEAAAADGLTDADKPAFEKAIRLIRRSAEKDRKISDALTS